MSLNESLILFLGRLHPMVVHAPIGILVALLALELWGRLRERAAVQQSQRRFLCLLLWLSATLTAATGWQLGVESGYGSNTFLWHRAAGITFAAATALLALAALFRWSALYRLAFALALVAVSVAGHFGAAMTHGADFLFEPFASPSEDARAGSEAANAGGANQGGANLGGTGPGGVSSADPAQPGAATSEPIAAPSPSWYEARIAPTFETYCAACHGQKKQKGGLALHTRAAILAGSEYGSVIEAGDPFGSILLERLQLALDDADHMPPDTKAQPGAEEVAEIERWIAAGASFDAPAPTASSPESQRPTSPRTTAPQQTSTPGGGAASGPAPPAEQQATPDSGAGEPGGDSAREPRQASAPATSAPVTSVPVTSVPGAARLAGELEQRLIEQLRAEQVHVEWLDPAAQLLWIDFRPRPKSDDAFVGAALEPLADFVGELSLAGTAVSDAALARVARLPRLERLDLSRSACGAPGLALLGSSPRLSDLILSGTALGDAALEPLLALASLERVRLWNCGLSPAALERLRAERPELELDAGERPAAARLEVEPEVFFARPSEGEPAPESAPESAPEPAAVNQLCPVTGKPVDARFQLLHEGRLVGFCCPNCPAVFQKSSSDYPLAD